jgi:hypothetical protein
LRLYEFPATARFHDITTNSPPRGLVHFPASATHFFT